MTIRINVNDLSIGELEEAEKLAGVQSLAAELASGLSVSLILALVTVWQRREDPTFDLTQARNLRLRDVEVKLDEDPTEPNSQNV